MSSSNLFVQLYFKQRLVEALRIGRLEKGVKFPQCMLPKSKKIRKIGKNPIVLQAVKDLQSYARDAYFIALVPDTQDHIDTFLKNRFLYYVPPGVDDWMVNNWGFLTWVAVEKFCRDYIAKHLYLTEILYLNFWYTG